MKTWLIALVMVIAAGCTGGVQNSDSSDTTFLVSTSSATTVVPTTVVKTTIPQTTTSQTPTSTIPGCEIFVDSICPPNSVDPRLACLPNCNGVDFAGLVAPGLNFGYFDSLEGANFSSADLRGASFYDGFLLADFTNADLSDSFVNLACFGKKMRGVKFDRALFYKVCFDGSDLSGATFINATLQSVCFLTANLKGVDFSGAVSPKADETTSGMHGIGFPLSKIEGVIPSDDFGPTALDVVGTDCDYG
jgi:hypothetical protein